MQIKTVATIAAAALLVAGCAGDADGDATEGDANGERSAADLGTLVVGIEAPWDLAYVPTKLAVDKMVEQGYDVEVQQFEEPDVMAQALDSGDVNLATNSAGQILAAKDAGLDIKAVLGLTNPTFVMASKAEFTECADLDGKRVGVQGQQDFILAATRTWIENTCPGTEPEFLEIPGSENRMAALLQDQIDATGLHILRSRQLQQENPDQFTTIEGFGAPENVISAWFYAETQWLEENPELMAAFADAYDETIAEIAADPQVAVDAAQELITDVDPELLGEVTEYWATNNAWPAKEGTSEEVFDATLAFYEDISPYNTEMTYEGVVWPAN